MSENVNKYNKLTNSVLSFDILNDINDWLWEKNGENDKIGVKENF